MEDPNKVIQVSITMEKNLKAKYSKLALEMDVSFSQLCRIGLRQVEQGFVEYRSKKFKHVQSLSKEKGAACKPTPQ